MGEPTTAHKAVAYPEVKQMKILVLGGTQFVGRNTVEAALARGHEVTVFHRGKTQCTFSRPVAEILGDREAGFESAAHGDWDAVLDMCAYRRPHVRETRVLKGAQTRYMLISTMSVYSLPAPGAIDENSALAEEPEETLPVTGETYGGLKVGCEREAVEIWGESAWIVRPGFIVGPHDHTDRFTYWATRVASGERFVAPEWMDSPFQFVDARDLAEFVVQGVEKGCSETVNCVGGRRNYTFADFCREMPSQPVSMPDPEGVQWPMIFSEDIWNLGQTVPARAEALGLRDRPVIETIRDVVAWRKTEDRPWKVGLSEEREAELLA